MENVYTAPGADLSMTTDDGTYAPKFFAVDGRIGRIRYLAYHWLTVLAFFTVNGSLWRFRYAKVGQSGQRAPTRFIRSALYPNAYRWRNLCEAAF